MKTKTCPNCGSTIHEYATKCKYCDTSFRKSKDSYREDINSEEEEDDDIVIRYRKADIEDDMQLTSDQEQRKLDTALMKENIRQLKKEQKKAELQSSLSYTTISNIAKWMDKYQLDAFIGFVPIFGDIVPTLFIVPYIYVSLFKIKSIPLTLAVIYYTMVDWFISILPYGVGMIGDFFYRSFKKNMTLITGFVEDDAEVIQEVNKKAFITAVLIIIIGLLIWWILSMVVSITSGIFSWISGLFA